MAQSSRSREGAWIEILTNFFLFSSKIVAPVRERGLKYPDVIFPRQINMSLP